MQKFADGLRVAKRTSDKIFRSTPGVLLVHLHAYVHIWPFFTLKTHIPQAFPANLDILSRR
jgi:hypothetical protein